MTKDYEKKIDDIYTALIGDSKLGMEGLVSKVERNTKDITGIKQKTFYVSGLVGGFVIILKWLGVKIWTLI